MLRKSNSVQHSDWKERKGFSMLQRAPWIKHTTVCPLCRRESKASFSTACYHLTPRIHFFPWNAIVSLLSFIFLLLYLMFQRIIKLLLIKQRHPPSGQALLLFAYSPAAQPLSLPKAVVIKQAMTLGDTGTPRVEQRRWRFLSHRSLKTAPSSLVIFVPWQDLRQKRNFAFSVSQKPWVLQQWGNGKNQYLPCTM